MGKVGIPENKWVQTCVLIDKLEKIPLESLTAEMESIGLEKEVVQSLLTSLKVVYCNPYFLISSLSSR